MREVLFKAKRLDGEWVEGSLIVYPDQTTEIVFDMGSIEEMGKAFVRPETICQYTGMTDKNGKHIFEGDNVYDPHENSIYTVEWNEDNATFLMAHDWHRRSLETAYYCEVIGSIHDGEGDYVQRG
jgi:hypothetical protein|nr:MAG TPA: YopX protein [Caudoviricetes sp.]